MVSDEPSGSTVHKKEHGESLQGMIVPVVCPVLWYNEDLLYLAWQKHH
jgi:hypothetical protein